MGASVIADPLDARPMAGPCLLVVDTATREAIVALAEPDGRVRAVDRWVAGYRHGEELLARADALLAASDVSLGDLCGIVVGTGPGAFTGLRVGLATAKGLAHALRLPIVGVSTADGLIDGVRGVIPQPVVLLLPAGPSDRVVCRESESPRLVPGGEEPELRAGERIVAVDLEGRADEAALSAGAIARNGLAAALAARGAARLASGDADDLARLVPEYVTLPRGVRRDMPDEAVRVADAD